MVIVLMVYLIKMELVFNQEFIILEMEISIQGIIYMEVNMGLEFIIMHQQDKNMKDNGEMICGMEKGLIHLEIQIKFE